MIKSIESELKIHHNKNANFNHCKHMININEMWIPCELINESNNTFYIPSMNATIIGVWQGRIFRRYCNKFDWWYINANSIQKYIDSKQAFQKIMRM